MKEKEPIPIEQGTLRIHLASVCYRSDGTATVSFKDSNGEYVVIHSSKNYWRVKDPDALFPRVFKSKEQVQDFFAAKIQLRLEGCG